jgi:cell division protein FtsB
MTPAALVLTALLVLLLVALGVLLTVVRRSRRAVATLTTQLAKDRRAYAALQARHNEAVDTVTRLRRRRP